MLPTTHIYFRENTRFQCMAGPLLNLRELTILHSFPPVSIKKVFCIFLSSLLFALKELDTY